MKKVLTIQQTEHILITGVTGNIGSHVLFELINQAYEQKKNYKIYLVIRRKERMSALERFRKEVVDYPIVPLKIQSFYKSFINNHVEIIETDLASFTLPDGISKELTVYHLAASINLSDSPKTRKKIEALNYHTTLHFINQLKNSIKKLVFVSTAFSIGDFEGNIIDQYHHYAYYDFRNPYEEFKLSMEKQLLTLAKKHNYTCTIVRPSVVGGRLQDMPKYVMSRYIVFYMLGAFFMQMKRTFGTIGKFRLVANMEGGLNIVPVDYVSKAIVAAADIEEAEMNITLSENVPNNHWIPYILDKCGVKTCEFVREEPVDKSEIEVLYYKTVGRQISKYLNAKIHNFESKLVRQVLSHVEEPKVTQDFCELYDYAHYHNFKNVVELVKVNTQ